MKHKKSIAVAVTGLSAVLVIGVLVNKAEHTSADVPKPKVTTAKQMLAALEVAEEESSVAYDQDYFGEGWTRSGPDHCLTRDRVLARDSLKPIDLSKECKTEVGEWISPYDLKHKLLSDKPRRGCPEEVGAELCPGIDIDHMVPKNEAWQSGAQEWSQETRVAFKNDFEYAHSLLAVSSESNSSKDDDEPQNWMPENSSFRCKYVGYWIAVKYRWGLSVDSDEKANLKAEVKSCGAASNVEVPKKAKIVRATAATSTPISSTSSASSTTERYETCNEAASHGQGPYVKGKDPEYYWYRDGDGDGTVCE